MKKASPRMNKGVRLLFACNLSAFFRGLLFLRIVLYEFAEYIERSVGFGV